MKIAILISCHKKSKTISNKFIKPIQVGCELTEKKIDGCLYDNEGENISSKNKRYCELTAQYYAWKNIDADYYGFFHYRRYLSFAKRKFAKWPLFDPNIKQVNEESINKLCLNEKEIEDFVTKYDLIIPKKSYCVSNYYHYKTANGHHIRDLNYCLDVIKEDYPEIYTYAKKYMRSGFAYFCNMFIMKKEIFNDYCSWLFDILKKHESAYPCKNYNVREYRVSGFLAERLCGIYITYLLKTRKDLKVKKVQRVKIKNTEV